jgi:hypothetical protein
MRIRTGSSINDVLKILSLKIRTGANVKLTVFKKNAENIYLESVTQIRDWNPNQTK